MMLRRLLLGSLVLGGCGQSGMEAEVDEPGAATKADDAEEAARFACQNVTGLPGGPTQLLDHHDPIAELLLKAGETCPANYGEMVNKLRELDTDGCADPASDLLTRIVSDDARLGASAPDYRTVTTRGCNGREEGEFIWTLLGVRPDEDISRRSFIEMAAFDPSTELFNYYTLSGNSWRFEADSVALLDGQAGCADCHPSGGVIMKELDDPWVHWESEGAELPGADQLFDSHREFFGLRGTGRDLEDVARSMNGRLATGRIRKLSDPMSGSIERLLQPLFCTVEVNLDTAGTAPDAPVTTIPFDALLDPHFIEVDDGIPVSPMEYDDVVARSGQSMSGFPDLNDTAFKFLFPERSGIDVQYVEMLIDAGIVDDEFVTDVLAVAFTQPLFSDARCDLLGFAPSLDPSAPALVEGGSTAGQVSIPEATPEQIRLGFVQRLQDADRPDDTARGEFLANLEAVGNAGEHRAVVEGFLRACAERPSAELIEDVFAVVTDNRTAVSRTPLIENARQMPQAGSIRADGRVLDPVTCTLGDPV